MSPEAFYEQVSAISSTHPSFWCVSIGMEHITVALLMRCCVLNQRLGRKWRKGERVVGNMFDVREKMAFLGCLTCQNSGLKQRGEIIFSLTPPVCLQSIPLNQLTREKVLGMKSTLIMISSSICLKIYLTFIRY